MPAGQQAEASSAGAVAFGAGGGTTGAFAAGGAGGAWAKTGRHTSGKAQKAKTRNKDTFVIVKLPY